MAIALTDFRGLCGFLPIPEIESYLRSVPEFRTLVSNEIAESFLSAEESGKREQLQLLFSALMQADADAVKDKLAQLTERYNAESEKSEIQDLVLTLNNQHPGDVGVFCVFMLNHVKLTAGQAIFLGAGEPHAYVSGGMILVAES
jgi:mannose-6-phosphate isomerase